MELKEIALELLSRWFTAENTNICESSFNIQRDLDELEDEYREYKQKIEEASA